MRRGSLAVLAVAALFTSACRSGTADVAATPAPMAAPAAPMVNAAGRWALVIEAQGSALELVLDLRKVTDTEFAGTATSQVFPPMTLTKVTLTGNKLMIQAPAPTGDMATFNLVIDGDRMTGEWSMPGMGSGVSGRRIP
jgi:hypothetical protein